MTTRIMLRVLCFVAILSGVACEGPAIEAKAEGNPPVPEQLPMSAEQVAQWMNARWSYFDENDDSTPVGLTIQRPIAPDGDIVKGIYCHTWTTRPAGYPATGCLNGWCDCRMSAALFNHKSIVTPSGLPKLLGVSLVLNQDKVETTWAKCSYPGDGGTDGRYNNGCGCGPPNPSTQANCNSRYSAYSNICPSTDQTCTYNDTEVKNCFVTPYGPMPMGLGPLPDVAVNYHGQEDWTPGESHLRDMVKQRLQIHPDPRTDPSTWNEVVIDLQLMLPELAANPKKVVLALVTPESWKGAGIQVANSIADNFHKAFGVQLPIVTAKDQTGSLEGPFVAAQSDQVVV